MGYVIKEVSWHKKNVLIQSSFVMHCLVDCSWPMAIVIYLDEFGSFRFVL